MSRYMLDTDIASYLIRGEHPEVTDTFTRNYRDVCISAITAAELHYGAQKRNNPQLMKKIQAFCSLVQCVAWNVDAVAIYAKLRAELEFFGTPIGSMDMLIAASAMAEGVTLVTNNTAHFSRINGLQLENWVKR